MATKAVKEGVILVTALYAWTQVTGSVTAFIIGNFVLPPHPIPASRKDQYSLHSDAEYGQRYNAGSSVRRPGNIDTVDTQQRESTDDDLGCKWY